LVRIIQSSRNGRNIDFQRRTMVDNMETPLFKHVEDNTSIETNLTCGERKTDVKDTIEEFMIHS